MTTCVSARASAAPLAGNLVLANGTAITLRPIGPEDRGRMAGLFAHLGPESRRSRFFLPKRELSPRDLTFFTDIDHVHHEAIAAINQRDDTLVGVARYVGTNRAGVADVAIEVADAFQRMGIGTVLARLTIQRACANGLAGLSATTLWENRAARSLLHRYGFHARHGRGGEIEYELKLGEPALADMRVQAICTARAAHTYPAAHLDRAAASCRQGLTR